jgi:hypothetical protein
MNNETIQPLEGFAPYFGIDPDDLISELGIFKRDDEGNYDLVSVELVVQAGAFFFHAPDHLARVEALITERDPLRCTECRKLGPDCDCDGA